MSVIEWSKRDTERNITEMDAAEATGAEGSMDNEVLNGIGGLGPSLEC